MGQFTTSVSSESQDGRTIQGTARQASNRPSQDLDETHDQQFDLIEDGGKPITNSAFKLLLSSQDPLTTEDFVLAVSFCQEKKPKILTKSLLGLCFNLLSVSSYCGKTPEF